MGSRQREGGGRETGQGGECRRWRRSLCAWFLGPRRRRRLGLCGAIEGNGASEVEEEMGNGAREVEIDGEVD